MSAFVQTPPPDTLSPGPDTGIGEVELPSGALDKWIVTFLRDPRDLKVVKFAAFASIAVIPFAITFFLWDFPLWMALPYWAIVGSLADRVGLTIHVLIHNPLFKSKLLEQYIPGFMCLFFGHTPHTFYIHHVGMHHVESNMLDDTSTTVPFQRDSIRDFLYYWMRFMFVGHYDLGSYHYRRNRMKLLRTFFIVEFSHHAAVLALFLWKPAAAVIVFIGPILVMRYAMMAGNWAQHAFVDADDPDNEYKKSINLIHARHNRRCWNDGYHIVHHIHPTMHWSEMPAWFEANKETFIKEGAIVFSGIKGYQEVWMLLMTHNYDRLARHYVQLGPNKLSHDEVVAFLKSRTRAIKPSTVKGTLAAA